jgi:hypothetical protein
MSSNDPIKLVPRNVAALRRSQASAANSSAVTATVAGNPVSTRLESGVGNCFPGLECDLRNLERRFFPLLEVDITDNAITVVGVNSAGVDAALAAGAIDAGAAETYRRIDTDVRRRRPWRITALRGTFGPMGTGQLTIAILGQAGAAAGDPPDAWTAIRLLTEGTPVELTLRRGNMTRSLSGNRERYLDDNGALAAMFMPGELTQSLCSPWTHDFRDCGCFYWASNHPDIAQPPRPDASVTNPQWNIEVPWERSDRDPDVVPVGAAAATPAELDHYEINQRWQDLNFVIEGRELLGSYVATKPAAVPFANAQELDTQLRYAAGVELAVMEAYLASAYSLRATGASADLTADITAARAEFTRIAIGEMRHLRAVNNVLASIAQRTGAAFAPALRVARRLPGDAQPWEPRPATPAAIADYIRLEAPSVSVDGLYARILATLERDGTDEEEQSVRSIMAEGEAHFQTFQFIQEWLGRHDPGEYLRALNLAAPPLGNAQHRALQLLFQGILQRLHDGYTKGLPAGANDINQARSTMVQAPGSLAEAAQAVADAGFLVVFDALTDQRFAPIDSTP